MKTKIILLVLLLLSLTVIVILKGKENPPKEIIKTVKVNSQILEITDTVRIKDTVLIPLVTTDTIILTKTVIQEDRGQIERSYQRELRSQQTIDSLISTNGVQAQTINNQQKQDKLQQQLISELELSKVQWGIGGLIIGGIAGTIFGKQMN